MKRKKINISAISTTLNRSEMREIMAGSSGSGGGGGGGGGYCIPGWACSVQPDCICSVGFKCCCNGTLAGCFTSVSQCQLAC